MPGEQHLAVLIYADPEREARVMNLTLLQARRKVSALSLQFRNRGPAGKNQVGPPGKIGNGDLPGVNAEVAINRRQKIAGRAHP